MKFKLESIPMVLRLGVPEDERAEPQQVLVSVFFEREVDQAALTDDLADSLDYSVLQQLIVGFSERHGPVKLLEKLHALLKKDILDRFGDIEDLEIQIQKFPFEAGSITIMQ